MSLDHVLLTPSLSLSLSLCVCVCVCVIARVKSMVEEVDRLEEELEILQQCMPMPRDALLTRTFYRIPSIHMQ